MALSRAGNTPLLAGLAAAVVLVAGLAAVWLAGPRSTPQAGQAGEREVEPPPEVAAPAPAIERAEIAPRIAAEPEVEPAEESAGAAPVPQGQIRIGGVVVDLAWPPRGWLEERPVGLEVSVRILGAEEHQVRTGGGGRFEVLVEDPGRRPAVAQARVSGDDRRALAFVHERMGEGGRSVDLRLERKPHGGLDGRVVDVEGAPLGGVQVALLRSSTERLEAMTDTSGRFSFAWLPTEAYREFQAERAGFTLLHWNELTRAEAGGWEPVVLTMGRVGEVEVAVLGPDGAAAEGVQVALGLAASETAGAKDLVWADAPGTMAWLRGHGGHLSRLTRSRASDADGLVRFPDAWADRRLAVVFLGEGRRRLAEHHLHGELLLDAQGLEGEAIHVPAGGFLSLRAQPFGARAHLEGRVTYADGRPVPRAALTIEPLGREQDETFTARARSEADGRYALELADVRPGETLRVLATDGSPYRPGSGDNKGLAELVVAGSDLRADVVLLPVLSVSGWIRDPAGEPVRGWLEARPEASAPAGAQTVSGFVGEQGRFELGGLLGGTYELVLHRPLPLGAVVHRFGGIRAGAQDLRLVADAELDVTLAVRFQAQRPVGDYVLLLASPPQYGGADRTAAQAARSWPLSSGRARIATVGWPEGACIGCSGSMPMRVDGTQLYGYLHRGRSPGTPFPHRFEGLPRGAYVVGVDAQDEGGRPFAPVLGEPARFEGGEHELTFVLVSAGSVSGRVLDLDASLELYLEVRDSAGRRLPLLGASDRTVLTRPIPGDGGFELERLPAGTVILRIGTAHDLEHGGTVVEQPVQLAADETTSVEVVWR